MLPPSPATDRIAYKRMQTALNASASQPPQRCKFHSIIPLHLKQNWGIRSQPRGSVHPWNITNSHSRWHLLKYLPVKLHGHLFIASYKSTFIPRIDTLCIHFISLRRLIVFMIPLGLLRRTVLTTIELYYK